MQHTPLPVRFSVVPWMAILALAGGLTAARAELRWEQQTVRTEAKTGDNSLLIVFAFTNAGKTPVSLLSVQPSCGCMTLEPYVPTYAPGEKGQLRVHFDVQGRTGLQEKSIAVATDDTATPTHLSLLVNIPTLVQITPQGVIWNRGGPLTPQDIIVAAGSDVAIALRDVRCSGGGFEIESFTETDGRRYRVHVTPRSTATPLQAQLEVKIEAVAGQPEVRLVPLRIN